MTTPQPPSTRQSAVAIMGCIGVLTFACACLIGVVFTAIGIFDIVEHSHFTYFWAGLTLVLASFLGTGAVLVAARNALDREK